MITESINTWEEFIDRVYQIKNDYEKRASERSNIEFVSPLIFRGQENNKWKLETTLERKISSKQMAVQDYIYLATKHIKEIESYSNKSWDIVDRHEIQSIINSDFKAFLVNLPNIEYLLYLRHHGFPSPILDWTESVFIASYFAFIDAKNEDPAVFMYIEMPDNIKHYHGGPFISTIGPYIKTDIRHYTQKAQYTYCVIPNHSNKEFHFHPHEDVFEEEMEDQDVLYKFILSIKLKEEVLSYLNLHNISHYTLFQSEDALIKSIETKIFDLP